LSETRQPCPKEKSLAGAIKAAAGREAEGVSGMEKKAWRGALGGKGKTKCLAIFENGKSPGEGNPAAGTPFFRGRKTVLKNCSNSEKEIDRLKQMEGTQKGAQT